jgi:hypothetical protein
MQAVDPARALLDLVEADRVNQCDAIARETAQTARALLREARHTARARLGDAMKTERRRLRDRLSSLDAALATESRLHAQRHLRVLLDEAWRRLPVALEARWQDPATRREWTRHIFACARRELEPGDWSLVHAPGWPGDERRAAIDELAAAGYALVEVTQDAGMRAGLKVRCGYNVLDGTLHGLLADRNAIGARMSDELSRSVA